MRSKGILLIVVVILAATGSGRKNVSDVSILEGFNRRFAECVRNSDHAGMLAMWASDGVDLMPGEAPLVGKVAIAAWLEGIEKEGAESRVLKEELEFHDVRVSGDWASEWADELQTVQPQGKSPVDGYGKIALVLHREGNGQWSIKQEMWNDSPVPASTH
jgi:ketosteroid isomerase-like protein